MSSEEERRVILDRLREARAQRTSLEGDAGTDLLRRQAERRVRYWSDRLVQASRAQEPAPTNGPQPERIVRYAPTSEPEQLPTLHS